MIVEITSGKIEGLQKGRLCVFKGIPYPTSPVGSLDFKPPVPAEAGDEKILKSISLIVIMDLSTLESM
uniref:carboxylesterase family protein n=1 Tax=Paenibacillus sp. FSL K6-0276 TaxID=2921450 RepID=UPI00403F8E32